MANIDQKQVKMMLEKIQSLMATLEGELNKLASAEKVLRAMFLHDEKAALSRKEQISMFLLENGAQRRKAIIAGTKIPPGSVDFALNDKEAFKRVEGGLWDLAPAPLI